MKTKIEANKEEKETGYFILGTSSGGFLIDLYREKPENAKEETEFGDQKTLNLDTKLYQRPTSSSRTIGYVTKQD